MIGANIMATKKKDNKNLLTKKQKKDIINNLDQLEYFLKYSYSHENFERAHKYFADLYQYIDLEEYHMIGELFRNIYVDPSYVNHVSKTMEFVKMRL